MDIKDKDLLKVDIDVFNKLFDQLSLVNERPSHVGSYNGEGTESSQIFDFPTKILNVTENDFKTPIKLESDQNTDSFGNISNNVSKECENKELDSIKAELFTDSSLSDDESPLTVVKKEEITDDFESEHSTDFSSSDDEKCTSLLERGGKEIKKRRHRRKSDRPRVRHEKSEFESSILIHCNSGFIVKNNSCISQVQRSPSHNAITSSGSFFISNIGSPESGYDTSQSSAHSPSPPNVESDSHLNDEQQKKREIFNQLLEIEKNFYLQNSINRLPNRNVFKHNGLYPLNSAKTNVIRSSENSTANFQTQSTDEDSLLIGLINDLYNSQINPNATTSFGLEIPELVVNQSSRICCNSTCQQEESCRRISYKTKEKAKEALRNAEIFNDAKYKKEEEEMLIEIKNIWKRNEKLTIIKYDEREEYKNLEQTNLHSAVIESNLEKVYCIVETLKRFGLSLFDINNKDKYKKTALDYAVEQDIPIPLLIDYLIENNAVRAKECWIK